MRCGYVLRIMIAEMCCGYTLRKYAADIDCGYVMGIFDKKKHLLHSRKRCFVSVFWEFILFKHEKKNYNILGKVVGVGCPVLYCSTILYTRWKSLSLKLSDELIS